jgi:ParB family chromosome partitioning protein
MRIDKAKVRYPAPSNPTKEERNSSQTRPSVFTESHRGEFYNIDVSKLIPFHKQARRQFDEEALKQMAETIKTHGVRQPLTIIPKEDDSGKYEVISGERRLRAAILAGLKTVPCIIIHDHKAAVEIALIENVQRKDLHPIELAKAYQQLLDENVCANKIEIANKLGLPKSSVTETMQLLTLPKDIQSKLLNENITSRILFREILDTSDHEIMLKIIDNKKVPQTVKNRPTGTKRKILLKVVLSDNQIFVDTNTLSQLSFDQKKQIKQQLLELF